MQRVKLSFRIYEKVIVVLNSNEVAKDLLEKNGHIYYDRPVIPIHEIWVVRLLGQCWSTSTRIERQWPLSLSRSDERWRRGRKLLGRGLRPGAAASHRLMIQMRARVLPSITGKTRTIGTPTSSCEQRCLLLYDIPQAG